MYLYLMDDITSLNLEDIQVISSLENLINTAYAGYNIVDAKKSTFRFLQNCGKFGQATLQKIKQIVDFNNDYYSLFEGITYKFTVSGIAQTFYKTGNIWTIPLSCFTYGKLSGLELLAEDESDAKLLIHAIEHHQKLNSSLRNFNITVIPSNGGGTNIKKIVNTKIKEQNKLLVCFCDSDQESYESDLGGTTKECRDVVEGSNFPCYFFKTEGKEIENDLPFHFIDEVINDQNDPAVRASFLIYKKVNELDRQIIQFTDYKEGITYKHIQAISCSVSKQFWLESIEKLKSSGLISNTSLGADDDIIIPHLSQYISSNVLNWLNFDLKGKPKKVHEVIKSDDDAQAWLSHGKNLFWLASGMKKGRI